MKLKVPDLLRFTSSGIAFLGREAQGPRKRKESEGARTLAVLPLSCGMEAGNGWCGCLRRKATQHNEVNPYE